METRLFGPVAKTTWKSVLFFLDTFPTCFLTGNDDHQGMAVFKVQGDRNHTNQYKCHLPTLVSWRLFHPLCSLFGFPPISPLQPISFLTSQAEQAALHSGRWAGAKKKIPEASTTVDLHKDHQNHPVAWPACRACSEATCWWDGQSRPRKLPGWCDTFLLPCTAQHLSWAILERVQHNQAQGGHKIPPELIKSQNLSG